MTVYIHYAKQLHMTTDALQFITIPSYVVLGQYDDAAYVLKLTDAHNHPYYYSIFTEPVPDETVMVPSDVADTLFHPLLAAALLHIPNEHKKRLVVAVPLSDYQNASFIQKSLEGISYEIQDLKTNRAVTLKFEQVEVIPTTVCVAYDALMRDRLSEDDLFEGDSEYVRKYPTVINKERVFCLLRISLHRTEWVVFREEALKIVDSGLFPQSLSAMLFKIKRFYMDKTKESLRPYSDEQALQDGYAMYNNQRIDLQHVIKESKANLASQYAQQIEALHARYNVTDQLFLGEDVQILLDELQEECPSGRLVEGPEVAVLRGLFKVFYLSQIPTVRG